MTNCDLIWISLRDCTVSIFFLCLESSWKQIFVSFIKYLNLIALRRKNTTCLSSSLLIMSHYLSRAAANYVSLRSHAAVGARARPSLRRQLMAPSPCQRVKEHPSASRLPSRPQSACYLWRISWRRCEENELTTSLSRWTPSRVRNEHVPEYIPLTTPCSTITAIVLPRPTSCACWSLSQPNISTLS